MLNLRDVLKIPSVSRYEKLVINYIENYCIENKILYKKDYKGNLYLTKGNVEKEYFPCVVAHMDTVHDDQIDLIEQEIPLDIIEEKFDGSTVLFANHPLKNRPTGIGGDDKCGVYICLRLLEKIENIKCAFFVEEEIGMRGSSVCDLDFFNDVGYALQFDAPTMDWFSESCSGYNLWTEDYFGVVENILKEYNIKNISKDPFTDVVQLRKKFDFCCSVLPTGYYNQHSANEFVVEEETESCVNLAVDFIKKLGNKKYYFQKNPAQGSFLI
jgi:putative aminopeptidase FrvX